MADNATSSYLKLHGLDRLVAIFAEQEIQLPDFSFLRNNPAELQQLLPKLRDRIDFMKVVEHNTKSTQADLEPPIICRETLIEICSKNDFGRAFLDGYRNVNGKREYSPDSRVFLKKALVEHFFRLNKGHITHNNFMEMVQTIRNELPDEDVRTWYVPQMRNKSGGGLLYNRYRYIQHTDKRFKQSQHEVEESGPSRSFQNSSWETLSSDEKERCEAAKHKLQVTGYSDSENITTAWKQSFSLRRKEALAGQIKFREWEVLVHFDNVHELVNYDFRSVHSIKNDTLALHGTTFVKNFNKVFHVYRSLVEEDKPLYDTILTIFNDDVQVNGNYFYTYSN
ncbi:uncharacterized protein LOC134222117 [Armigeres subalbatus]|uniref:uncharacterized protein LOC134222117 n=1 Tax=Armigeres subalbatus TaxID=124917 RepID=UPI002ED3B443